MLFKRDFAGASSNIDSKRAPNLQNRIKKSTTMIRLLRADGTPLSAELAGGRAADHLEPFELHMAIAKVAAGDVRAARGTLLPRVHLATSPPRRR